MTADVELPTHSNETASFIGEKPKQVEKPRLHVIDNARFVMQFFVFFVHVLHNLGTDGHKEILQACAHLICLVDIPVFAVVSGFLSKGDQTPTRVRRTLVMLLVPWLLCDTLRKQFAHLFALGTMKGHIPYDIFRGYWYLGSLVVWRMVVPMMNLVNERVLFGVSLLFTLGWPYILIDERIYCSRAFEFLPFFVFGLHMTPEWLQYLELKRVRVGAGCVILAIVSIWLYNYEHIWFVEFRNGYRHNYGAKWVSPCIKAGVLCIEFALMMCVLAVMPKEETVFSSFGTRSLYSYIIHPILITLVKKQLDLRIPFTPWAWSLAFFVTFLVACLLMSSLTQKIFWVLVEPRWIECILKNRANKGDAL